MTVVNVNFDRRRSRSGLEEFEWRLISSYGNDYAFSIDKELIHSKEDPIGELRRITLRIAPELSRGKADQIVLLGLGLGYFVNQIRHIVDTPILIWDPVPGITKRLDVLRRMNSTNIEYITTPQEYAIACNKWAKGGVKKVTVLLHGGYQVIELFEQLYVR